MVSLFVKTNGLTIIWLKQFRRIMMKAGLRALYTGKKTSLLRMGILATPTYSKIRPFGYKIRCGLRISLTYSLKVVMSTSWRPSTCTRIKCFHGTYQIRWTPSSVHRLSRRAISIWGVLKSVKIVYTSFLKAS